jgi:hypothetical protein
MRRGNRFADTRQDEGTMQSMLRQPAEIVGDYPASSVLLVFGIGLGVGFVIGNALCQSSGYWHQPTMSERWRQGMYDSLSNLVPESVSRRFAS